MSLLVVGGGISGLAAALELGRAGIPSTIVEASDRLGGKIATERAAGFVLDLGPDSILTTRPAAIALARELGLDEELIGVSDPRLVHILRDGTRIPMPDGVGLVLPTRAWPFVTTRLFSWPEKARIGLDLVMPRVLPAGDVSVGAFLRRRLGRALVSRLAGPLVGGIYGTSIEELSLDAITPTLRDAERRHRSLILAGLADGRRMRTQAAERARSSAAVGEGERRPLGVFASLRGGVGQLVDALEQELESMGCVSIARGVRIASLRGAGSSYRALTADGREIRADGVIVTTPGPAAASLLGEVAPRAAAAISEIPHGSTSVVSLAYRAERFPGPVAGHGWLIPTAEKSPLSAITWSSNKWAGRAPEGHVLVRAFLPDQPAAGHTGDELAALARLAVEDLSGVRGAPEYVRVSMYEGTMPRYTVGHLGRVERAERELAGQPRLAVAGAPYRGVGLPDCISSARGAARRVLEALSITPRVEAA